LNEVVPIGSNFIEVIKIYPNDSNFFKLKKSPYSSPRHF